MTIPVTSAARAVPVVLWLHPGRHSEWRKTKCEETLKCKAAAVEYRALPASDFDALLASSRALEDENARLTRGLREARDYILNYCSSTSEAHPRVAALRRIDVALGAARGEVGGESASHEGGA